MDGGEGEVTPPEVPLLQRIQPQAEEQEDDGRQGLSETRMSGLVESWRLMTSAEREDQNMTEGQANLVARLAKSRKKRRRRQVYCCLKYYTSNKLHDFATVSDWNHHRSHQARGGSPNSVAEHQLRYYKVIKIRSTKYIYGE